MVEPVLLQSLSTDMIKGSASMILTRFNQFRIRRVQIDPFMMSRQNYCSKREPYQCAVLILLFSPDQSGENKNKHFTCEKIKNADEMRFING